MGDRNHLHVCRHCGIVHATASSTAPESCVVCGALTFSEYELNGFLGVASGSGTTNEGRDDERARTAPSATPARNV